MRLPVSVRGCIIVFHELMGGSEAEDGDGGIDVHLENVLRGSEMLDGTSTSQRQPSLALPAARLYQA